MKVSAGICIYGTGLWIVMHADAQSIQSISCDKDGRAHIVTTDGRVRIQPKETDQIGCDNAAVSLDGRSAGWFVLENYPNVPYPLSSSLVILRDRKKRVFGSNQVFGCWRFIGGTKVATLTGPIHGLASEAELYDVRSGKLLETWNGKGETPEWAEPWAAEFVP